MRTLFAITAFVGSVASVVFLVQGDLQGWFMSLTLSMLFSARADIMELKARGEVA